MQLPTTIDPRDFELRYRHAFDLWRPAVHEVCAWHGLICADVQAFRDGSNLVAAVGERFVVKLFPPFHRHQWESERRALPHFLGQLPVHVPELVADGERNDGYTYVVLERVAGRPLEEVWSTLPHTVRAELLHSIGELMAVAHNVPLGDAAALEPLWEDFLRTQVASCRAHHAGLGAPAWVRGRGPSPDWMGAAQRRGLLALLLAHRYAHLDVQLRLGGWRDIGSLDALAERVFGGH
jgi:hygromycin-B 7''-O-kinase